MALSVKNSRFKKQSALFLVGRNFSHSPIITIEKKGFENFSRQKILVRGQFFQPTSFLRIR